MESIIPFNKDEHYLLFKLWAEQYGADAPPLDYLPENGLIIPNICCGFIFKTDSAVCYIELLTCNKDIQEPQRGIALNLLTSSLIDMARSLGFKCLIGMTKYEAVSIRAEAQGYSVVDNYKLLIKPL